MATAEALRGQRFDDDGLRRPVNPRHELPRNAVWHIGNGPGSESAEFPAHPHVVALTIAPDSASICSPCQVTVRWESPPYWDSEENKPSRSNSRLILGYQLSRVPAGPDPAATTLGLGGMTNPSDPESDLTNLANQEVEWIPLGEGRRYVGSVLYEDGTLLTTKEYRRGQGSDDHMRYAVWTITPGGARELPVPVIYRAGRYWAGMTPQSSLGDAIRAVIGFGGDNA